MTTRITVSGRGFGRTRSALIEARNMGVSHALKAACATRPIMAGQVTLVCDVRGVTAEMTRKVQAAYAAGAREALGNFVTVTNTAGDEL